jgi:hypothetical protein
MLHYKASVKPAQKMEFFLLAIGSLAAQLDARTRKRLPGPLIFYGSCKGRCLSPRRHPATKEKNK